MKKVMISFTLTFLLCLVGQINAQWETIEFGGEFQIRKLFTIDNDLFVVGNSDSDKLFLSTDNGTNFTTLALPNAVTSIYCVEGHNGMILVGTNEGIYLSSDSGSSWVQKNNGLENSESVYSLRAANDIVYAGGGNYSRLYRSSDNGETWVIAGSSETSFDSVQQIEVSDSCIYIFVNRYPSDDVIYKSSDNGSSWPLSLQIPDIRDFWVNTSGSTIIIARTAITSGGSGVVYSTNFGDSYSNDNAFDQASVASIHYSNGTFFIGTIGSDYNSGIIYRNESTNNEWVNKSNGLYSNIIGDIKSTDTYLFVTHNADSVIGRRKLSDFGIATNVKSTENIPYHFTLNQNYPNPFNPSTTINYSITKPTYVSIKVFDVLGRQITELVNGHKPAGNFEVIFNAENYSSGIYFYTLKTNEFIKTKKMILLR